MKVSPRQRTPGSPATLGSSATVTGDALRGSAAATISKAPDCRHVLVAYRPCSNASSRCLQHMGWRFSALRKGLQPAQFWGIRRSALAHSGSAADSGAEGS